MNLHRSRVWHRCYNTTEWRRYWSVKMPHDKCSMSNAHPNQRYYIQMLRQSPWLNAKWQIPLKYHATEFLFPKQCTHRILVPKAMHKQNSCSQSNAQAEFLFPKQYTHRILVHKAMHKQILSSQRIEAEFLFTKQCIHCIVFTPSLIYLRILSLVYLTTTKLPNQTKPNQTKPVWHWRWCCMHQHWKPGGRIHLLCHMGRTPAHGQVHAMDWTWRCLQVNQGSHFGSCCGIYRTHK